MPEHEKRSSIPGMTAKPIPTPRGGGSAPGPAPAPGGGGYLDNCTIFEDRLPRAAASDDSRIVDLAKLGLSADWQQLAGAIGYENFLVAWYLLDRMYNERAGGAYAKNQFGVPSFQRWKKHQRNQLIATLDAKGWKVQQIQRHLQRQLGDKLSIRHLERIIASTNA